MNEWCTENKVKNLSDIIGTTTINMLLTQYFPTSVRIKKIVQETPWFVHIRLSIPSVQKPGQFVNVCGFRASMKTDEYFV